MTDDPPTLDPSALDRLLETTGGDPDFVRELVETFIEDAGTQLAGMEAAAASGSADVMLRPAHSLKSNAASVGALRLSELARGLEADARAGAVPDATARVAAVRAELAAAQAALAIAMGAS